MQNKEWLKEDIDNIHNKADKHWYTFQVYYNNELSVKDKLNDLVIKGKLQNVLYVLCPYEEVVSITLKKKERNILKKALFPGYVFVCFNEPLTVQQRALIIALPKVSKLLQSTLTREDLHKISNNIEKAYKTKEIKYKNQYEVGDMVIVTTGSLENFKGVISKVDLENQKVIVNLQILKRETPTEIDIQNIQHYTYSEDE